MVRNRFYNDLEFRLNFGLYDLTKDVTDACGDIGVIGLTPHSDINGDRQATETKDSKIILICLSGIAFLIFEKLVPWIYLSSKIMFHVQLITDRVEQQRKYKRFNDK